MSDHATDTGPSYCVYCIARAWREEHAAILERAEAMAGALDGYRVEHDRYSAGRWAGGSGICSCWCCAEARTAIAAWRGGGK